MPDDVNPVMRRHREAEAARERRLQAEAIGALALIIPAALLLWWLPW